MRPISDQGGKARSLTRAHRTPHRIAVSQMRITVAICTWNRSRLLDQTLASLASVKVPPGADWKVVVVNNNSTDDTEEVLAKHASTLPLDRLFEPCQGHCASRNRAMASADCDLLIWTDDDVILHEDWLVEFARAADQWPDAAFFAGRVDPWFEVSPSSAMVEALDAVSHGFCGINLGTETRRLTSLESPKGANMAFRMHKICRLRFDTNLGIKGNVQTRSDETAFCEEVVRLGEYGVWAPRAILKHFVPADRIGLPYLRDFYVGLGQTYVRRGELSHGPTLYGVPRWLLRRYGEALVRRGVAHFIGDDVKRYRSMADVWRLRGMIRECDTLRTATRAAATP